MKLKNIPDFLRRDIERIEGLTNIDCQSVRQLPETASEEDILEAAETDFCQVRDRMDDITRSCSSALGRINNWKEENFID
jgi:hypothetical protein